MKRNAFIKLFALALFTSGTLFSDIFAQETETREIPDVTKVSVSSGINLYITQGNETSLVIEAEKDQMNKIVTEVKGNQLRIYRESSGWSWKGWNDVPKVKLTIKEIEQIMLSGGADVYSKNTLKANSLSVKASGGADAFLNVDTRELHLQSSGGADIKVEGKTEYLTANSSGGSDIMAKDLAAKIVKASASGGGDATVYATEEINANASGGGDVLYYGNPAKKQISESGGGDVTKK
ncbi:DUF2807 domain-containing protein [Marinilabiliaceae bacterium JC017]|nr:DUF2807 domain-containing protein [Marinilabiliaceae bacterium JC017]